MDLDKADKLASVASAAMAVASTVMTAVMLRIMIKDRVRTATSRQARARHALGETTFGRRLFLRSLVVVLVTTAASFSQTELCGDDPTKGAPCNWASIIPS